MVLGCEDYQVSLYRKGGNVKLADFPRFTSLTFGRHMDETVTSTLTVPTGDCCDVLGQVGSWGTEIVVFRGGERVAEGPVVKPIYDANQAQIPFKDVSAWLGERLIKERFTGTGRVVDVAAAAIRMALIDNDPNILRYLDTVCAGNSVHVKAKAPRYSQTWLDYLTSLDGLDWTVHLRRIVLMPQGAPLGYGPNLSDDDFAGLLQVMEDGDAVNTHEFVTNGTRLLAERSLEQPFYGVHERMTDVSASGIDEIDAGTLATQNLQAGYPIPVSIVVPSGALFTPQSHIDFNDLIPGVLFDVRAANNCRPLEQKLRLLNVDVTVDAGGEKIAVTFANPTDMPDCRPIRIAPTPPTPETFSDDFNRPDGPIGNGWTTRQTFGDSPPEIFENKTFGLSPSGHAYEISRDLGFTPRYVAANVYYGGSGSLGRIFCGTSVGTSMLDWTGVALVLETTGTPNMHIETWAGGTPTVRVSVNNVGPSSGAPMSLVKNGTTYEGWRDGVLVLSWTGAASWGTKFALYGEAGALAGADQFDNAFATT